jgi:hypothetical protein
MLLLNTSTITYLDKEVTLHLHHRKVGTQAAKTVGSLSVKAGFSARFSRWQSRSEEVRNNVKFHYININFVANLPTFKKKFQSLIGSK